MKETYEQLNSIPAIQEILNSELSYNTGLIQLEDALQQPNLVGENALLNQIGSQISTLKTISDNLLENVQTAINMSLHGSERELLRETRSELIREFFGSYKLYGPLYVSYIKENSTNPAQFSDLNNHLQQMSQQTLQALLMTVIQRGPRYKLLFTEATKVIVLEKRHVEEFTALIETVNRLLEEANSQMTPLTPSKPKGYKFGDITRGFLGKLNSPKEGSKKSDDNNPPAP